MENNIQEVTATEIVIENNPIESINGTLDLLSKGVEYAEEKIKEIEMLPDDDPDKPYLQYNFNSKTFKLKYWRTRYSMLVAENGLYRSLSRISDSYIYIGKMLSEIKEKNLYSRALKDLTDYKQETPGYSYLNFEEYCKVKFNLKKSSAYALIDVYKTFGTNDGQVSENYSAYNYSQLSEMVSLSEKDRQKVTPEMTVKDIRAMKKALSPPKGDGDAVTDLNYKKPPQEETVTVEAVTTPPEKGNVKLIFKNKTERSKWVEDYAKNGYLWVDVPPLNLRVYRYDFINGVSLLTTEYGPGYGVNGSYYVQRQLIKQPGVKEIYINEYYGFYGLGVSQVVDWMTTNRDQI